MRKIAIYAFDDVEELGFSLIYNILKKTQTLKRRKILPISESLEVDIVSEGPSVVGTKGMSINPHRTDFNLSEYDILIIPGGKGVETLLHNQEFLKKIKKFGKERIICSIGLGAIILAEAGLLEGKKATTHHKHFLRLKNYCTVESKRIVISDNIITAGGMLCAIDLAAKILELCYSQIIVDIVLEHIEKESRPKGIRLDLGEIDDE